MSVLEAISPILAVNKNENAIICGISEDFLAIEICIEEHAIAACGNKGLVSLGWQIRTVKLQISKKKWQNHFWLMQD